MASGTRPTIIEREQQAIEKFVRDEYWRLAKLKDGRFAYTRAPLVKS